MAAARMIRFVLEVASDARAALDELPEGLFVDDLGAPAAEGAECL
jgi:hypothetical protein